MRLFVVALAMALLGHVAISQTQNPNRTTTHRYAVIGDAGLIGPDMDNLKNSILGLNIEKLILPGDNLYLGRYDWTWDGWKDDGLVFDVVALGNHHKGYENEMKYFAMPGEYYTVTKGGARFVVLNSDNENTANSQCAWADQQLNEAQEKPLFVVYHHPSYDLAAGHSWRTKEKFQLCMRPLLQKYKNKITAVLLGHDHISTLVDFGGVNAVVAGSGREVDRAHSVDYEEDGLRIKTLFLASRTQHWVELNYQEGQAEAIVHFTRVSDYYRTCTAQVSPGQVLLQGNCARSLNEAAVGDKNASAN